MCISHGDAYLARVEHDFSFDVIALFIHHIHLLMQLSAKILRICAQNALWARLNVFPSTYSHQNFF